MSFHQRKIIRAYLVESHCRRSRHSPHSPHNCCSLVIQLVRAKWKKKRVRRFEGEALKDEAETQIVCVFLNKKDNHSSGCYKSRTSDSSLSCVFYWILTESF